MEPGGFAREPMPLGGDVEQFGPGGIRGDRWAWSSQASAVSRSNFIALIMFNPQRSDIILLVRSNNYNPGETRDRTPR